MTDTVQRIGVFPCLAGLILPFIIASCAERSRPDTIDVVVSNPNAYQVNHGPFDENGNYVEAWADNPPKRRYVTPQQLQREDLMKNGVQGLASNLQKQFNRKKPQAQQAVQYQPQPAQYQPQLVANYQPTPPEPEEIPEPKVVAKPKPKPQVAKATPKPKPKPTSVTHTVRKGDTLYALSRKYGATVSAIQKANRISGSNIRIGQKLSIPR